MSDRFDRIRRQLRDYTSGFDVRRAHRELGRDASRAYEILTREYVQQELPEGALRRLWHRIKIVFLGVSYKLTPPRRILFIACVVFTLLGLQGLSFEIGEYTAVLGPPIPLLFAIAGLFFLLALELTDRVLVRDELEVARQLQRDLLPVRPPEIEGYDFAFSYRTANTIGGDYYDFLDLGDGRWAVVIGDASGHGIAAGLLMAIANATLKLATELDPNPLAVADLMNRTLYRTGGPHDFMTMFYSVLDPGRGRLDYVCVGHPYPLLRRADGSVSELGTGCLPLGLRPSVKPAPCSTDLQPGDLLFLYTDGIPETVGSTGEAFGFERLRSLVVGGGSAGAAHDRVVASLDGFSSGVRLHDDLSIVAISRSR